MVLIERKKLNSKVCIQLFIIFNIQYYNTQVILFLQFINMLSPVTINTKKVIIN